MSAPEAPWALVVVNTKEGEEEEGDFNLANIQSEITKKDLVKLHSKFPIPPKF